MKFTRLVTGLTAAGLLGLTPVALAAAPANAGVVFNTVTTLEGPTEVALYKDRLSFEGGVQAVDATGAVVPGSVVGTVSLQVSTPKNPTWSEVSTTNANSLVFFSDVKAVGNAQYRLVYSGGTETSVDPDTFNTSESAPVAVEVARKVTFTETKRDLVLKAKVTPDFKKKKIAIRIQQGKKFVPLKKVTTDKKGVAFVKLPPPRRGNEQFFLAIVPADKHFAGSATRLRTFRVG